MKLTWINFLHLYQPANTDAHVIKEATEQSYYRIIRAIEEHPNIKFTLNITGCLFLRWEELGYYDLIERIGKLIKKRKIELTGTACYHPIIPLIPEEEVKRQIKENEEILQKHFGKNFKPKGFFFPEMAYSPKTAQIIESMGYKWIILDEMAVGGKIRNHDFNQVYYDKNSGLKVIIRSRKISNSYVPKTITKILNNIEKSHAPIENNRIITTVTDGELYGLRYIDHTAIFENLLKRPDLRTLTISEFIQQSKKKIVNIKPQPHSWVTSENEYKKKEPFNFWNEKGNVVQKKLWQLAKLAYKAMENNKNDKNYYWTRWHLVRGLASCTFWWASAKDLWLLSPISWNPDLIERGTNELIRSIRALDSEDTRNIKIKGEKLYISIKRTVWKKHWAYYWKK